MCVRARVRACVRACVRARAFLCACRGPHKNVAEVGASSPQPDARMPPCARRLGASRRCEGRWYAKRGGGSRAPDQEEGSEVTHALSVPAAALASNPRTFTTANSAAIFTPPSGPGRASCAEDMSITRRQDSVMAALVALVGLSVVAPSLGA